jgi:hypothetical protein
MDISFVVLDESIQFTEDPIVNEFMQEICQYTTEKMNYYNYSEFSEDDKQMIEESIQMIRNWDKLYDKGMQIIISGNTDVTFIEEANKIIQKTTNSLKDAFKNENVFHNKIYITLE